MHQIIYTTDDKYVGQEFEFTDEPIGLSEDMIMIPDKVVHSGDTLVVANSNYVIIAKKIN